MPNDPKLSKNDTKDEFQRLVESNPCSDCRVMGLPICRCRKKGGGSGSGSGGSGAGGGIDDVIDAAKVKNDPLYLALALNNMFIGKNEPNEKNFWSELPWLDHALHYENPHAFFHLDIEVERGLVTFKGINGLTDVQKQVLIEYLSKIENIFNQLKTELKNQGISVEKFTLDFNRVNNSLFIRIPHRENQQYLAEFVNRLIAQNLLPTKKLLQPENRLNANVTQENEALIGVQQEQKKTFNPTPFKMRPEPGKKTDIDVR